MKISYIILALASVGLMNACGNATDTSGAVTDSSVSSTVETATVEGGSASSGSEGSVGFTSSAHENSGGVVTPFATCASSIPARSTCTAGGVYSIPWGSCTIALGTGANLILGGTTTDTFFSDAAYTTGSNALCVTPGNLTNGNSFQRVYNNTTVTLPGGGVFTVDNTSVPNAWDGTSFTNTTTGTRITVSAGPTRTISINGVHKTFASALGKFDHIISTAGTPGLTVTGSKATANRVMNGSIKVYHQLAKYTAANTFNSVTWGSASCCFPTSGTVTTAITPGTDSYTTTFTNTCGAATISKNSAAATSFTLTHCN